MRHNDTLQDTDMHRTV